MSKHERIEYLIGKLNEASKAYYQESRELMSNYEYDKLYDELLLLETETGYSPENSPSKNIGYQIVGSLEKSIHEFPALSLDKTKSRDDLLAWIKDKCGVLSWKLDGLTVQITYDNGVLTKAVTRGNGEIGEDITHNAIYFKGIPKSIPFSGHLVCRGEALISYETFSRINEELEPEEQYKNPRNLASGSVRQLDAKVAAARGIEFKAFELVSSEGHKIITCSQVLTWLKELGFSVVDYELVTAADLIEKLNKMEKSIENNNFPSDGLVLSYDDIEYGRSLGSTGKFPRHSIAFKWQDDVVETTLRKVVWQASRTGLINPVAVFDAVELEGTTVERATAFNVSTVENLKLAPGSIITVYKANKIIPNIDENIQPSGTVVIPSQCPVCGGKTEIREGKDTKQIIRTLHCPNPNCTAKQVKRFVHFAERDSMNIIGVSKSTIEKFVEMGFIKEFSDFYHLDRYQETITSMEGFGKKSYAKIIKAIEKSREVKLLNFIYALGISNVGSGTSKRISKVLNSSVETFLKRLEDRQNFFDAEDVGEVINTSIYEWYDKQKRQQEETGTSEFIDLIRELTFLDEKLPKAESESSNILQGKAFVITGTLEKFSNRKDLEKEIESYGGKVSGSVSKNTSYLINNDSKSESSKNKKAVSLGVPIITEEEYLNLLK